ncbi:MAG: DEAD/DEAH box helicase [Treponema sp.]|jgi:ATP-dependent RNA helicase RhlB|nr:DEAD/DEAH box helicase [Treponema sp.]
MEFTEFSLDENLLKGIASAGYVTCTPVQEQVLKNSLDGSDLYVQSQTGTGKTAAYLVSIVQEMLTAEKAGRKALIMVPTRELAVQVAEEAKKLIAATNLIAASFYGGVGYEKQIASLKKGVDIIIGTPGRVIDLQEGRQMDLRQLGFLVIDEADRMFDMGFYPDLRKLIKLLPQTSERQTMLFSATLNSYVKNLAWEYTDGAKEITIEAENITVSEIDQELIHVSSDEKLKLLLGILKNEKPSSVLIFCNTKRSCEVLGKRLRINGFDCEFIIGDLPQSKRLQVLKRFKEGTVSILVATDVAARGIDVDDLAMVVNYDLPNEAENYVHRIGRTARAGKSGKAYTFCSEQDVYSLPPIERYIEMQIPAGVADPSKMAEDKSEGVYIRTENYHDDYGNSHGGYRTNRNTGSRRRNQRPSSGSVRTGSERPARRSGPSEQAGRQKPQNYGERRRTPREAENFDRLRNLSFEERMDFYKKKYAEGGALDSGRSGSNRKNNGRKTGPKKYTRNRRPENRTYPAGRSSGTGKKPAEQRSAQYAAGQPKAASRQKKGILSKFKSFFGKKSD